MPSRASGVRAAGLAWKNATSRAIAVRRPLDMASGVAVALRMMSSMQHSFDITTGSVIVSFGWARFWV